MRVLCIETNYAIEKGVKSVVKGNIYTVITEHNVEEKLVRGQKVQLGIYYELVETGHWYHNSIFIKINEDQIDETEFERNYNHTPELIH